MLRNDIGWMHCIVCLHLTSANFGSEVRNKAVPDKAVAISSDSPYRCIRLSQASYLFHKNLTALHIFCICLLVGAAFDVNADCQNCKPAEVAQKNASYWSWLQALAGFHVQCSACDLQCLPLSNSARGSRLPTRGPLSAVSALQYVSKKTEQAVT